MNSVVAFKKYKDIEWTKEQETLISEAFNCLDMLLLSCEREKNEVKYKEILNAHKVMHDISLTVALKDMFLEENK